MIDPADKLTQALPLDEQPAKRKRGRPATGKAMTPAEKQRAYRERQKAKSRYVDPATVEEIKRMQAEITSLRDALIATDAAGLKKIDELRAENEKLKKQLSSRDDNELMQRVELAEAARDAMGNELAKAKAAKAGRRKHRDDAPLKTILIHHNQMEDRRKSGELKELDALWRFVGATLQVIEQHGLTDPK